MIKMDTEFFSKDNIRVFLSESGTALLGITRHGLDKMGKVLFINLCDEGDALRTGEPFGDIEAHKGVFDLVSPVNGVVITVNDSLLDSPDALSAKDRLVEVELSSPLSGLLTAEEYLAFAESDTDIRTAR